MQKHSTIHGAFSVSAADAARDARHHCDQANDRRSYALTQRAADVDLYIHADSPDDLMALGARLVSLAAQWHHDLGRDTLPPPTTSSVTDANESTYSGHRA